MNRRDFLKATGAGVVSLMVPGRAVTGRESITQIPTNPNIVFILIDDMGWPDLGCYGSQFHETPNIDRLARQGMKFTDAYAACPVCSPTRASIMAGQYPARIGITDFIPGHWRPYEKLVVPENRLQLPLESVTVGEALKQQGYATCYIGKWHLGGQRYSPDKQGFDEVILGIKNQNDKQVSGFTDKAIEFIEKKRNQPFLLYLSHHTVHIPLEAPRELVEKYEKKPKPVGGVNNPAYAAMVEHLDTSLGRIAKKLDELDLTQRTLFIFFSDNGGLYEPYGGYKGNKSPVMSNAPLRDEKGTLYEGGIRVPLIVRWPGVVKPGTICSEPVTSVDFYPTFLDIVGAEGPANQPLDGESLLPLLKQTGSLSRNAIYWHYPHYHHSRPAGAIREGRWKLIEFYEDGKLELYDLASDLGEKKNLAAEMPQKAAELRKKLAQWRRSVKAKMPTPNPDYDPAKANQWKPRPRT
jgi:arylsulfatase A